MLQLFIAVGVYRFATNYFISGNLDSLLTFLRYENTYYR